MKKEFMLGEKFKTNRELHFSDGTIPKDTVFEINEIMGEGEYKVYFYECVYDEGFKGMCKNLNCEPNNTDGNVQICEYEEIIGFTKKELEYMDNIVQVKYNVDLQYKGTEFVGVIECYKIECKGIPCIKNNKLELIDTIYTQRNSDNISTIKFIEINNIIYPVSDVPIWYIDTEEVLKQIDCLIDKEEKTNKSYILISNENFKFKLDIDDLVETEAIGKIEEYCFHKDLEDKDLLIKILEENLGRNIEVLTEELLALLPIIENDKEVLDTLLDENPKLDYWLNSVDLYYYYCGVDQAYKEYLGDVEDVDCKVIDYMDVCSYIENETDIKLLEFRGRTVLYC